MGLNATARFKAAGVEARKTDVTRIAIAFCIVITEGPTAHPRWKFPIDPDLRARILVDGIPGRFTVREAPQKSGALMFEIIDGARRFKAALDAQEELRRTRPRQAPLVWDRDDPNDPGSLFVDLDLWDGDDAALLLARLDANRGGLPDSLSVLAAIVKGLAKLGCEDVGAIVRVMPRGITPKVVQALGRWGNLVPELRPRFDVGEFPPDLLPAVLDAPRDEQVATAERLKASGIKSTRGATRATNKARDERDPWARRMTPRAARAAAIQIAPADDTCEKLFLQAEEREGVRAAIRLGIAIGFRLQGPEAKGLLDTLPEPIADAIREARAAKPRKGA